MGSDARWPGALSEPLFFCEGPRVQGEASLRGPHSRPRFRQVQGVGKRPPSPSLPPPSRIQPSPVHPSLGRCIHQGLCLGWPRGYQPCPQPSLGWVELWTRFQLYCWGVLPGARHRGVGPVLGDAASPGLALGWAGLGWAVRKLGPAAAFVLDWSGCPGKGWGRLALA